MYCMGKQTDPNSTAFLTCYKPTTYIHHSIIHSHYQVPTFLSFLAFFDNNKKVFMAYACSSPSEMLINHHLYSIKHIKNGKQQLVPPSSSSSSRQVMKTLPRRRNQIFSSLNGAIPTVVEATTTATTKRLRVAYQGVPGAYSEFAAQTAYPDCSPVPCRAFTNVISAVELGRADLAVVPVESTLEGTAVRNYDLLLQRELYIVQEINLFVHYCLLVMPGVTKGEVKRVISHPMALAHCGRTLAQLGLEHEPVEDTAGAVELLLSNRMLDTAAIASSQAAVLYGLDVLAHGLQDESWNVTRFLILSKDPRIGLKRQLRVKTSMVVAHHSGSLSVLLKVLATLSSRNINLTKLEVNPFSKNDGCFKILDPSQEGGSSLKEFPSVLYVDIEGSIDDQKVQDAIAEISELPVFIRILGCYSADPTIYGLQ